MHKILGTMLGYYERIILTQEYNIPMNSSTPGIRGSLSTACWHKRKSNEKQPTN